MKEWKCSITSDENSKTAKKWKNFKVEIARNSIFHEIAHDRKNDECFEIISKHQTTTKKKKIRKRQTKKIRKRQKKKIRNAKSSSIQSSIEMQTSKIFTQRFFTRNFTRKLTNFISSFDENDFFSSVVERDFSYFNCIEFWITWHVYFEKKTMSNRFTTTIHDSSLINIMWQSYLDSATKQAENETKSRNLNCHLISIKETLTSRNINVDDRIACNLTNERFFYKLKINLKHHENTKILRIILKYRFFQYVDDIKFQKVVVREIEIKIKIDVEIVINKRKKKKNITKDTTINQLIRDVEARNVIRDAFTIRKNVLMKRYECRFLNCINNDKHCWRFFDNHEIESFHKLLFSADFISWQKNINQNVIIVEKSNNILLNQLNQKYKHDQRKLKKQTIEIKIEISFSIVATSIQNSMNSILDVMTIDMLVQQKKNRVQKKKSKTKKKNSTNKDFCNKNKKSTSKKKKIYSATKSFYFI